jgi:hypothetical protein
LNMDMYDKRWWHTTYKYFTISFMGKNFLKVNI